MTDPDHSHLEHLLADLLAAPVIVAAEAYAHGWRCVTVVHGDPETTEEDQRLQTLRQRLESVPGLLGGTPDQLRRIQGTNDTTTYWWSSSPRLSAETIAHHAAAVARELAYAWWHVREDAL